jgi:hypothetical protein
MGHLNKITIVFIVNGEDVAVEANLNAPLQTARNKALELSHNTGRPPEEWEIRDERGQMLDSAAKISSFEFTDGIRLFLTLRVGAGGK